MREFKRSKQLFDEARLHIPGGVDSPVRAYRGFDLPPPFISRALGAYLWDVDGNKFIDYVGSWGPMILGHAHSDVIEAIKKAADNGTSFGAPTENETVLAQLVKRAFPSIELVRLVSSGTEAVMSAIRVARGFTGKSKIIKFNGCYHGHADHLLVKAGSGAASLSIPDSSGVPDDFARHTLVSEYNDIDGVRNLVKENSGDIAAIIVEPVAGNMGCVPPKNDFLMGLRRLCDENKIILIFDEVITGFRVSFGGVQELYGISADLTCLGKILGGGLPLAAYGGRKDIMSMVAPLGPVYQAGTLSGNPVAVAAGIATLSILRQNDVYRELEKKSKSLVDGIDSILRKKDVPYSVNRVGSMFTVFFLPGEVSSFIDAATGDINVFKKYFIHMLENGIYLAPSPFECAFVSLAHSDEDVERTLDVLKNF